MVMLFSSDLNGTLVHQHTMSDMIRVYIGDEQYQQANGVFKRQTSGTASMEEAFGIAGPLTRGLTLRQAIEYTGTHIRYIDGFHEFVAALAARGIPLVVNSTGYSVTIYSIRAHIGADRIHGHIGNFLRFGMNADSHQTLREDELERKVGEYVAHSEARTDPAYDKIQATGLIDLGIVDEGAKAKLIQEYARRHFPHIGVKDIVHMGDTMGDSEGILRIAEAGGIGVAFNYNPVLAAFLRAQLEEGQIKGKICFIDQKDNSPNLMHVIKMLEEKGW